MEPARSDTLLGVESSVRGRAWVERLGSAIAAKTISQRLELPLIMGQVLAARGVAPDQAEAFLAPTLKALMPDPLVMRDVDTAADRLANAIISGEKVGLIGDYDVDGATSSALLKRLFAACGRDLMVHIPDRLEDGYGPNRAAFEMFQSEGVSLVITVDCGIAAHDPIEQAAALGLEVVVVDHHQAGETLPGALAVVNPNRHDDTSGLGNLAAVGVVFMLAVALIRILRQRDYFTDERPAPDLLALLDLVALGTVCDVVPLTGLNRALVRQGLAVMAERGNRGLSALCDAARLTRRPDTYALGFVLGPRLNAAGRLGQSALGAELLATGDRSRAGSIADRLNRLNIERQAIERDVHDAVLIQAERLMAADGDIPAIIASGDGWHAGVIGLAASRLVERFARPAVVIALGDDGEGVGSARSVPGVDLGKAVRAAQAAGLLVRGGGHAMAAGLTIQAAKIDAFRAFMVAHFSTDRPPAAAPVLEIDGALSAGAATPDFIDLLAHAGPFGAGNPEPRFVLPNHRISFAEPVGTDHVRCTIKGGDGVSLKAIAFRAANQPLGRALLDEIDRPMHIAGSLSIDDWGGGRRAQLRIVDVALAG